MFYATAVTLTYNQKQSNIINICIRWKYNLFAKMYDQIGQESTENIDNQNIIAIIAKIRDLITLRNCMHASFQYKIKCIPL